MRPTLSLILCSRNDAYMGNSRFRLETTLNYTADAVRALGLEDDVELVVTDWGSDVPLAGAVRLGPAAAALTRFVTVPPAIARARQGESPFPEVLALNAAARRARGAFIGRIDQDTLTGARFLGTFVGWARGTHALPPAFSKPLADTLLFANRRSIPYRLAVRLPPLRPLTRFLAAHGGELVVETARVFYKSDVGVWLAHRDLWDACGGYDERMIFMNEMDPDMVERLMTRHPLVDLGPLVGWDFYHLDHYHPRGSRSSSTHREVNTTRVFPSLGFRPSGDGWGLADEDLPVRQAPATAGDADRGPRLDRVWWLAAHGVARVQMAIDRVVYPFAPRWRRRARLAVAGVRGRPVTAWPGILLALWRARGTASRADALD
ncbi:MAG: hypothetical protein AB7N54_20915 [Alphaproteobacteria bacterium]